MLGFSLGIAGSFSLGSLSANEIDPVTITALRFAGSSVLMGLAASLGPGITRQDTAAPWRYLVPGTLMAIYFALMFEGLKTASAVSTSAVFTLTPAMSAIIGWYLLRQITTGWMALALFIGGCGALWVIFGADIDSLLAFKVGAGEMIFFVGCIAHAIYTPIVRLLNRGESPLVFVFGMSVAGTIVLTIYGWDGIVSTNWSAPAADRVDHATLPDSGVDGADLHGHQFCDIEAALGQGHGLHLPDPVMGHIMGGRSRSRHPGPGHPARCPGNDHCPADVAAERKPRLNTCPPATSRPDSADTRSLVMLPGRRP